VSATGPAGAEIIVAPSQFTVDPGESVRIRITIKTVDLAPASTSVRST